MVADVACEDVLEDIFDVIKGLMILIFTGEIFSYSCTFQNLHYTCPLIVYCNAPKNSRRICNLRGREVASASISVLATIAHITIL